MKVVRGHAYMSRGKINSPPDKGENNLRSPLLVAAMQDLQYYQIEINSGLLKD